MIQASQVIFETAAEDVIEGDQIQDGMEESAVFPGIEEGVAAADVELEELFDVALLIWESNGQVRRDEARQGKTCINMIGQCI